MTYVALRVSKRWDDGDGDGDGRYGRTREGDEHMEDEGQQGDATAR